MSGSVAMRISWRRAPRAVFSATKLRHTPSVDKSRRAHSRRRSSQASVPALEANLAIPFNKAALPGVTMTVGSPRGVPPGAQQVGQEGLIALIQSLFWSREAAQTCARADPG